MKRYQIIYRRCKCSYTAEALERSEYTRDIAPLEDDHDYLVAAVKHFCELHMMAGSNAHINTVDANTRCNLYQEWLYSDRWGARGLIIAETLTD